jgi:hypothetical protein
MAKLIAMNGGVLPGEQAANAPEEQHTEEKAV